MFIKLSKRIGLLAVVGLIWWYLYRNRKEKTPQQLQSEITVPFLEDDLIEIVSETQDNITQAPIDLSVKAEASIKVEDLTRINGIGPKISEILKSANITTYKQLANLEVSDIQTILDENNLQLARCETWPEQAKFAAVGDWDGLIKYLEEYREKSK
jgi:predicted flap endonuclease-1-like 5' DNA nuclease